MEWKVSSPCPTSWDRMAGDDKVRFCGRCRLNVYNLAEMSREEIAAIVRKTGGRLCGRLYVRADKMGTLRDCPRGAFRKRVRRALMVAGVLVLAGCAWLLKAAGNQDRRVHPVWVQTVLNWIDPEPERQFMLGKIKCR
jgi:hypothetical protein